MASFKVCSSPALLLGFFSLLQILVSTIAAAQSSPSPTPPQASSGSSGSSRKVTIIASVLSVVVSVAIGLGLYKWKRGRTSRESSPLLEPQVFTYEELTKATGNFSDENRIGGGKFGAVYKGELSDGSVVAIRDLSAIDKEGKTARPLNEGRVRDGSKLKRDIMKKLARLNSLNHTNLVSLKGCCLEVSSSTCVSGRQDDSKLFLIHEYMGGGSLDKRLYAPEMPLDWGTRYKIVKDVANGLAYLHLATSTGAIAHRGIKVGNILLVSEDEPHAKLADIGLFTLASRWTQSMNNLGAKNPTSDDEPKGQKFDDDVINFGFLALEIVFGNQDKEELREKARKVHEEDIWFDLVDPRLPKELSNDEVKKEVVTIVTIGLRCISQSYPVPSIREVEKWLKGKLYKSSSLFGQLYRNKISLHSIQVVEN